MESESGGELKPVLILDDDAAFRDLVAAILQEKGLSTVSARSPREATAYLAEHEPLMAIVDYRLPETDGLQWITQLRESNRNFPIIFCSAAWCDQKTFNWLRNILRVSLILRKPIEPSLFWHQIEGLLPASVLQKAAENLRAKHLFSAGLDADLSDEDERLLAESGEAELLAQLKQLKSKLETQQKLTQVRMAYMTDLKEAWKDMANIVSEAQKNPGSAVALEEARGIAHKLRGTAGSLGFKSIGESAGKVEDLLQALDPTDTLQEVLWWEIIRTLATGQTQINEAAKELNEQAPAEEQQESGQAHVLIVGDKEYYRSKVKTISSPIALAIEVVDGIEAAADRAKRRAYEAVIIDLAIDSPERGFKLAQEIRSLPGMKEVPFGFVCPPDDVPDEVDLAYAGCSYLLEPSPSIMDLEQCVNHLMTLKQASKPRVLTCDDDEVLTKFIATILEGEGMLVRQLNKPIQILETVEEFNPDLLVLDVIMPGLSGYDVCRMLRATERFVHLPIIFLTSKNDQAGRSAAFQAGADDFLSKPVLADELLARVRAQLEHEQMARGRQERDRLTGSLSRRDFVLSANDRLIEAKTLGHSITFCLLTIDDFVNTSILNSLFTAEETIQTLSNLLHKHFKAEDLRGRWSEDTFVLAFPTSEQSVIGRAMERLLAEFKAIKFRGSDADFHCSFSAGLSQYPSDGDSLEVLLNAANTRLLSIKRDRHGAIAFTR